MPGCSTSSPPTGTSSPCKSPPLHNGYELGRYRPGPHGPCGQVLEAGIGRPRFITPMVPLEYRIWELMFRPGRDPAWLLWWRMAPVAGSFASTQDYAGCAVLALRGELEFSDSTELSSRLAAAVSCRPWVIVDLADLASIDGSSLDVLLDAREQARLAGGDLLLAGPRGGVATLLLTGSAGGFFGCPS